MISMEDQVQQLNLKLKEQEKLISKLEKKGGKRKRTRDQSSGEKGRRMKSMDRHSSYQANT